MPEPSSADIPAGGLKASSLVASSVDQSVGLEAVPASPIPSSTTLTKHRAALPALTGLRFFAAAYVVAFHTRVSQILTASGHVFAGRFMANGFLAVPLFFLLSGFILAYTYRGQIVSPAAAVRFWEARFARLWPAYMFSLLCSSIPLSGVPTPGLIAACVFMVQGWNPMHPEYTGVWNMVCWTLTVEAFFYLVFPFAQPLLERLKVTQLGVFGALLLVMALAGNVSTDVTRIGWSAYIPAPVIHLPEFLLGATMGNLFLLRGQRNFPVFTVAGIICSIAALGLVHDGFTTLILPAFMLLLYGLASERSALSRILSTRLLVFGGAISYSMYLLQSPVRTWVRLAPALNRGGIRGLLAVPAILLPLAILSFLLIEEPSRLALRRMFAKLDAKFGAKLPA